MAQLTLRGVPAAVICSTPFRNLGTAQAKVFGVPDLPLVMIPHPLGGIALSDVQQRADHALPQLLKLIGELRA
ncbi:MAG: hypothetical protein ACM3SS_25175 [Rhodospirillaceae bacterium]